jgi:hypothetical protein
MDAISTVHAPWLVMYGDDTSSPVERIKGYVRGKSDICHLQGLKRVIVRLGRRGTLQSCVEIAREMLHQLQDIFEQNVGIEVVSRFAGRVR